MAMVDPVLEAVKGLLEGLDLGYQLTVQKFAQGNVIPPAAVIEVPTLRRKGIEEAESQMQGNDWFIDVPVTLYFDLRRAGDDQARALEAVEAFIQVIDANQGLGVAGVIEAKLTQAEPAFVLDQQRTLFSYECTVEVLREYVYTS